MSDAWAEREKYVQQFIANLEARLDNVEVAYTTYDDIVCTVRDGEVTMHDTRHDLDLKDVHVVHFKNWMFDSEQAAMIAAYLDHFKIPFFNTEVNAGLAWGKISQMCRLALAGVVVPDTYFAKQAKLREWFESDKLPEGFAYPLILKADNGSKGNDNFLVKTGREALAVILAADDGKEFVLQNFLPNDGDYRFLFIGLDNKPMVFHRKGTPDTHLNNTSQGGTGTMVELSSLPGEYVAMARKAAEAVGREISGVDIIVDKQTSKPYVLEVNSTPVIATGYAIEAKNAKFAEFLQQQLEAMEEE